MAVVISVSGISPEDALATAIVDATRKGFRIVGDKYTVENLSQH